MAKGDLFDPIFPGMDPFIEGQRWRDFHNSLIIRIKDELARLLVPQYSVISEEYVYLGMYPDVVLLRGKPNSEPLERSLLPVAEAAMVITPTIYETEQSPHVTIRDDKGRIVTIVELLSPTNKTRHREDYLANRNAILGSEVHLVELDLLSGGERLERKAPREGYVIMVARSQNDAPHRGELYPFGLRDPFPIVPVPLKAGDRDVPLDLPSLFLDVYVGSRYRLQLDYTVMPPLGEDDAVWVVSQLTELS